MKQRTPDSQSRTVLAARAEASAWITRLHGLERTPEMEAGFRRWLAERPENAQEFEGLTEVWELLGASAPARAAPRLERWERSAEARELRELRADGMPPPGPNPRGRRLRAGLALAACAVLAVSAFGLWRLGSEPTYATAVGEQRVVRLADGTRISLNSDSRLVAAFGAAERRVRLVRGEVLFEVAKDAGRPFVVDVDGHSVTALGTSFVVRLDDRRVAVTLIEGKVAVAAAAARRSQPSRSTRPVPPAPPADSVDISTPAPEILLPGQRLVLSATAPPRLDTPRLEAVTAWRRGEVLLDDTPLAEAVAEMNRYDGTTIVIDSPRAANLIVSGLYHTGDSAGFAHSVAQMYGLHVTEHDGRIHLH